MIEREVMLANQKNLLMRIMPYVNRDKEISGISHHLCRHHYDHSFEQHHQGGSQFQPRQHIGFHCRKEWAYD